MESIKKFTKKFEGLFKKKNVKNDPEDKKAENFDNAEYIIPANVFHCKNEKSHVYTIEIARYA